MQKKTCYAIFFKTCYASFKTCYAVFQKHVMHHLIHAMLMLKHDCHVLTCYVDVLTFDFLVDDI